MRGWFVSGSRRGLRLRLARTSVPQRLKPQCRGGVYGTAEAVPLTKEGLRGGTVGRFFGCLWKAGVIGLVFVGMGGVGVATAGGPRFVTGTTFTGVAAGTIMAFYTPTPLYYTDPGALNANVSHAQADAMVAAAAGVWNIPTSMLVLAQGGVLSEHVSGGNSYLSGMGVVFPADVQASNYLAKPIAVIYDTDGSVTELLLGSGASEPSACLHNAVTESVDGFGQTGTIEHAVIVLNGRCVGAEPEQMLQMQYQLERVFGRVVGLAWAQVNDDVFTGVTPPTAGQLANWPVMHPIDVICGPYTYQCMQNVFQLRPDDESSLGLVYPVTAGNVPAGKTLTVSADSMSVDAQLYFPGNQDGMEEVNLTMQWGLLGAYFDSFQTVSAVSGARYQRNGGNPVTGRTVPATENVGRPEGGGFEGWGTMGRVPLDYSSGLLNSMLVSAEAINPLYSGEYAVGTYEGTPLSLMGTAVGPIGLSSTGGVDWQISMVAGGEPSGCAPGNDGVERAPVSADASGWWTGLLCGPGHVSWWSATVKAGRTWTLETTAVDETGAATTRKARPVMGVWLSTDAVGGLPTVAGTASAMNSYSLGMTQLPVAAATQGETVRFAIADLLGAGRPDFNYKARMLYADSVAPGVVGSGGGRITITGMGFRAGNEVMVNGVQAAVVSWSATQIVASAPSMTAAGMSVGVAADVAVVDPGTGGQTVMSGVLVYSGAADTLSLVSAPAGVETGVVAGTAFAVRVLASDGITGVAGSSVMLGVTGGAALGVCGGASSCVVSTDAMGLAQSSVSGVAVGTVVLRATEVSGGATVSVTLADADPVRVVTAAGGARYLAAGAAVSWSDGVAATQDGVAAGGVGVSWSGTGVVLGTPQGITDSSGMASVAVQTSGLVGGTQAVVTGCVWVTVCASSTAYGVGAPLWTVAVQSATLSEVVLLVTDGAGHPLQGAAVQVYQTVSAWEGTCVVGGRCAAAPVLAKGVTAGTSDASGLVVVAPMVVAGVPQVVNVAAATGTQGFVTVALVKGP